MFTITRDLHKNGYTKVSNTVTNDSRLSLQAKGFMLVILSLSDNWHFSVAGMAQLCGISRKAVSKIINELTELGYVQVERPRDGQKRYTEYMYRFYEQPQDVAKLLNPVAGNPVAGNPVAGNPVAGDPVAGNPVAGNPVAGKCTQTNNNKTNNKKTIIESTNRADEAQAAKKEDTASDNLEEVKHRIDYNNLRMQIGPRFADSAAEIISECMQAKHRTICGEQIPSDKLKSVFGSAGYGDVIEAYEAVKDKRVEKFVPYFTSALYNTVLRRSTDTTHSEKYNTVSKRSFEESSMNVDLIEQQMFEKYRKSSAQNSPCESPA